MFRARPPIEEHVVDWLFETYAWLLDQFGGMSELRQTDLVLPTAEYFPVDDIERDELAGEVFLLVKQYARMLDWPCRLVMTEPGSDPHAGLQGIEHSFERSDAAGTFTHGGRRPTITYSADLIDDPTRLVATFAHELGHYLLAGAASDPPGGFEAEEPATDVAAVFMGFGVFLANGVFAFEQFSDGITAGWSWSRQGYLGEADLAYALAIFAELQGVPDGDLKPHLSTNARAYFKKARKHIARERRSDLADLEKL